MNYSKAIIGFMICGTFLYSSCKKDKAQKITCDNFQLSQEYYWFPQKVGDTVIFRNDDNEVMKFIIKDKLVSHRKSYMSDKNCSCLDISGMNLSNGVDSIWFVNNYAYIPGSSSVLYQDVVFKINGVKTSFYDTETEVVNSLKIDSVTFTKVYKYEYNNTDPNNVKRVYFVKNLGVAKFELVNGEVWTIQNLKQQQTSIETFTIKDNPCD